MMPILPYMLSAVLLGALVAFQPLANAILARAIGSPYGAAAISIAVAGIGALAMVGVTGAMMTPPATKTVPTSPAQNTHQGTDARVARPMSPRPVTPTIASAPIPATAIEIAAAP